MTPSKINGFLKMPQRDSARPRSAPALRWCGKAGKHVPATMYWLCSCNTCRNLHTPMPRRSR